MLQVKPDIPKSLSLSLDVERSHRIHQSAQQTQPPIYTRCASLPLRIEEDWHGTPEHPSRFADSQILRMPAVRR